VKSDEYDYYGKFSYEKRLLAVDKKPESERRGAPEKRGAGSWAAFLVFLLCFGAAAVLAMLRASQ
jgi:hypothetical protein